VIVDAAFYLVYRVSPGRVARSSRKPAS